MRTARLSSLAALAALVLASGAGALPAPNLPPGWSHAVINVVIKRQPHTLTYDRGTVQAVTPTSLSLRERDGTVVNVAVSPATKVTIAGKPATIAQVRRFEVATTVSIDGGPAATVKVRIPAGLGALVGRAGVRR